MADSGPFREGLPLGGAGGVEAEVGVIFLRDVPSEGVAVEHLPFVLIVGVVGGLPPVRAVADDMEILRHEAGHAGEKLPGLRRRVQRAGVVRHDIVEIDTDPEAMRNAHETHQIRLGPVFRPHRAALVAVAEVEAVKRIEAHREGPRARLEGRRQPERIVAALRQLRQAALDFAPGRAEVLQDDFGPRHAGEENEREKHAWQDGFHRTLVGVDVGVESQVYNHFPRPPPRK